ncbi:MAG: endonuclease III domain-containing protein [Nanoarchaeota archaeon]
MNLQEIYDKLFEKYGEQKWWPIINDCKDENKKKFEIIVGAILTQNTSWKNVEKAIKNLYESNLLDAKKILKEEDKRIAELIKPAGYYNQKSKKLKAAAEFFLTLNRKIPTREALLNLWGVGKETADSILLYAYNEPFFVVDAYTKRIFSCIGNELNFVEYDEWQKFFHENLPNDPRLFNEFHALIVEHCKRICLKNKKMCKDCFFNAIS